MRLQDLERLEALKTDFSPTAAARRQELLRRLSRARFTAPALLYRYHELLCFLCACPDRPALLRAVRRELNRFGSRVDLLRDHEDFADILDQKGLARTAVYCPVTLAAAQWLAARHPRMAHIDWDGDTADRLSPLLPFIIPAAVEESVEVGGDPRAWLRAAGMPARGDLAWLVQHPALRDPSPALRALFDTLQVPVRWDLRDSSASRTRALLPAGSIFFHTTPLLRCKQPLAEQLPGTRIPVRRLPVAAAQRYHDAAMAAVITRYREIHGFNYADPHDVRLADLGRGLHLAWFGILPAHRLPLRAHTGYLLLKNGIPCGYGDVSLLAARAEVAFNLFPSFRAGESAYAFVRLLAFLRQHCGSHCFVLDRYQVGYHNPEAIAAGAFWFYYKLGFRPQRADLARLAAREAQRLARGDGYRCPPAVLKRLAQANIACTLAGDLTLARCSVPALLRARPGRDPLSAAAQALTGRLPSPARVAAARRARAHGRTADQVRALHELLER